MEASHYAVGGAGFVVLDEVYGADFSVEDLLVVAFEEVASGVFEDAGLEDDYSFYISFDYLHICLGFFRLKPKPVKERYFG